MDRRKRLLRRAARIVNETVNSQGKKQAKWWREVLFYTVSFVLLMLFLVHIAFKSLILQKYGHNTVGIVYKKGNYGRSGNLVFCEFRLNGENRTNDYNYPKDDFAQVQLGDTLTIRYLPSFPFLNEPLNIMEKSWWFNP